MNKKCDEEWVRLEEYPNYEINRTGKLRNNRTGIIQKFQQSGARGPLCGHLVDKNGKKAYPRIDELVASVFLPHDGTHSFADLVHLDGNNTNCSVDNLSWDFEKYASKQYYEKTGIKKPEEYFHFYPLMEFPESPYEINKMGQLRNKYTRKIFTGALNDAGYKAYSIRIDNKTLFRLAHIMVAKQFIPNPENKPIVNHIDENKANPCIDNLEWATLSENVLHGTALNRGNLGRNKPVNEYTIYGKYIRTWKSIKHLSDFLDSLYPVRQAKSFNSLLNYYLDSNREKEREKLVFANRVFIYYEGDCDDLKFKVRSTIRNRFEDCTLDGIDVPNQYIIDNFGDRVDSVAVLQAMLRSKLGLSNSQKIAVKYAIECIKKVRRQNP